MPIALAERGTLPTGKPITPSMPKASPRALAAMATLWVCGSATSVHATEAPVATVIVESSDEAIAPVLSRESLPKELSIDAFSAAELLALKTDVYRIYSTSTTGTGCAGWLFLADDKETRLVGVQVNGSGMVKLNGRFRSATVLDSMYVSRFQAVDGIDQARQLHADWLTHPMSPWVLASGGVRLTGKSDMRCTALPAARCRRYTFEGAEFAWGHTQAPADGTQKAQAPIRDRTGRKFRFIVEDMCPATRIGMVEGAKVGRMGDWGDQLSSAAAGFRAGKSLKEALKEDLKK